MLFYVKLRTRFRNDTWRQNTQFSVYICEDLRGMTANDLHVLKNTTCTGRDLSVVCWGRNKGIVPPPGVLSCISPV